MAVTKYYTADNEIFAQETAGQRLDYMPDVLGSVVAAVDQAKTMQSSARYKPYGDILSQTGLAFAFAWKGAFGYVRLFNNFRRDTFIRARFLNNSEGRWLSVDPLWPGESAYTYVSDQPTLLVDPSGTSCASFYNAVNRPGAIPPSSSLSGCRNRITGKPCNTQMPSAATMTCLIGKETDFDPDGDVGYGPGNVLSGTIKDWCRLNRGCLPNILGVSPQQIDTQKKCENYIKGNSNAALKLAAADLGCNGLANYGYSSREWPAAFELCASCMELTMSLINYPDCPPANPSHACETCIDILRNTQREIRKHKHHSRTS